jgi:hypothetical protein
MSLVFNGSTDLGPLLDACRAFRHFGQLSPGNGYGYLHGAFHAALTGDDGLSDEDLDRVSTDSLLFLQDFGDMDRLNSHEKWILSQLINCNK